jgi:hypothetical protein
MQLNAREEDLLRAFRRLPAATADELSTLVQRLARLAPGGTVDWSDSWSDADLAEFTAAAAGRIDADEQEEPR